MSGAVLAGGEGSRFGADKAGLVVDGTPVLRRLVGLLSGLCGEVVVAVGRRRPLPFPPGARPVEDPLPGTGPLGGVYAALTAIRGEACLVLACDMPFVSRALLRRLCRHAGEGKAVVFEINGHVEPFPGVYPRSLLPRLEGYLGKGGRGVQAFLRTVPLRLLPEGEARRLDPGLLSFANVNAPEDLDRWGARCA